MKTYSYYNDFGIFRYENIIAAQQQQPQYPVEEQQQYVPEPRRPPSRGKARIPSRQKRQAQGHRQSPQPDPPIQYSTRLPSDIQQILKFQQQTPYINGIPEQFRYVLEFFRYLIKDSLIFSCVLLA